jgi:hypothetical protein
MIDLLQMGACMAYETVLRLILDEPKFSVAGAEALSTLLHLVVSEGYVLSPTEEALWHQLTDRIIAARDRSSYHYG